MHHPLQLRCVHDSLASNYLLLQRTSGTRTGAALKANAYGLGAAEAAKHLLTLGCRDFFVSSWWETEELDFLPPDSLSVLHGFGVDDLPRPGVRPVLISAEQIARWRESAFRDEPCDIMVDTGMNRLGVALSELDIASGLNLHTLHSHLACADEDHVLNARQLQAFRAIRSSITAKRYSLANSAGVFLGPEYGFDLVRPGLALYGGIPRREARGKIRPVAHLHAQVLQVRSVEAGESVGYNALFVADRPMKVAIINAGYADGFWRSLGGAASATHDGAELPIVGRISMDLIALDSSRAKDVREGEWVELAFDLERMAAATGLSQYELLTGLGRRWERIWS